MAEKWLHQKHLYGIGASLTVLLHKIRDGLKSRETRKQFKSCEIREVPYTVSADILVKILTSTSISAGIGDLPCFTF